VAGYATIGRLRTVAAIKTLLVLGFALHFHHHFHGSPIDYAGLAAAAAASWLGVPGPGEPVLIAAGIFAARHKLDIGEVLLVAWASATAGGIAGWLIGLKAGRTVLEARGPFWRARTRALARGEEVFARHPVIAITLTPSWVAGINRARMVVYLLTNAASAAVWAGGIGLGAYFAGPAVVDVANDAGLVTEIGVGLLILVIVASEIRRRRRRADTRAAGSSAAGGDCS
jgi:membrane protein DedA with SNARE-associated domain